MGFTDQQVNNWLEEVAGTCWASLHYESPGVDAMGASEISGGSYARQQVFFNQPSNRAIWSVADVRWTGLPAVQITHFGLWSAATKGFLMAYGQLPQITNLAVGQGFTIIAGDLVLSLS